MTAQEHRYHAGNEIYFSRDPETGDVVIDHAGREVIRLDCHQWASVMASVSAGGENGDSYHEALNFHMVVERRNEK